MSQIRDVYRFAELARGPVMDGQLVINWPLLRQAMAHIAEEQKELEDGVRVLEHRLPQADTEEAARLYVDVLDAACDLAWVSFNVLYSMGLEMPQSFWASVARANLRKIPKCPNCRFPGNPECELCHGTGRGQAIIKDDKVQKPDGWVGPHAEQIALIQSLMEARRGK